MPPNSPGQTQTLLEQKHPLHPTHHNFKPKSRLPSMAALSIVQSFHRQHLTFQELRGSSSQRILVLSCCQGRKPVDTSDPKTKEESKRKLPLPGSVVGLDKFGKMVRDSLSPKRKGDWKDVTLMSISFAVYVYISQKLVCAYFAWMSMPKHPW